MEWGFLLGLTAITLLVIASFIYFGRKFSKAVEARAAGSDLAVSITPAGSVLFACMAGFWVACIAARILAPESDLGSFVGTTDGVGMVLVGSILFGGIAAEILNKLGYPIVVKTKGGA